MKIFSATQIRAWDSYTIQNEPISSIDLMERASIAFSEWFIEKFAVSVPVYIYCGSGNNGGDGLAIARLLHSKGYKVVVYKIPFRKYSQDYIENEKRLINIPGIVLIEFSSEAKPIPAEAVIIDAIFGSGLNRPLEGLPLEVVQILNQQKNIKVSVDIASGLYSDSAPADVIFIPDFTVTFQTPKFNHLLPGTSEFTGELIILDIKLSKDYQQVAVSDKFYVDKKYIQSILKQRSKYSHKGTYGKVLILAGKYGSFGAAVLAAKSAYRSGAGLVYACLPSTGVEIMQIAVPEVVVIPTNDSEFITFLPDLIEFDCIAIGPGISEEEAGGKILTYVLEKSKCPLVIDASALNILGKKKELISKIPPGSILTPHPKEFERIVGSFKDDYHKLELQKQLAEKIKGFVLLKGAHSTVATPEGVLCFNSTGNPGMATGGSGDVLTGIIAGLSAQGYVPNEAAILGMFLHGYAGDKASKRTGIAPLLASDIIDGIKDFYLDFENS